MSTETHRIHLSGLEVDVVRKNIKNLHLGVYPPAGRVRVAAPMRMTDEAVRLAVIARLPWIRRQRAMFHDQERQSVRLYVTGETHYFQGHRYRLNVVYQDGLSKLALRNKTTMDLYMPRGSDSTQRERVVLTWYRRQLKAQIPRLMSKWEAILGVKVAEWGVKQMKTKWGSCNRDARRIWLNLELAKKPVECLEYIVAHEMLHFLVRHHDDHFAERMDKLMPRWRLLRSELNKGPLRHEAWGY